MPDPGQPATLRRLAKRAGLCLLLGAILQYAVAAAFSMGGTYGMADRMWNLVISNSDDPDPYRSFSKTASLRVLHSASTGRVVLSGIFRGGLLLNGKPDWSQAEWLQSDDVFEGRFGTRENTLPGTPPPWSRLTGIQTDPAFDYYPGPALQGSCLEVVCGWPMPSASYYAGMPNASGSTPYVVREGLAVENRGVTPGVLPRVIPLAIYWPGAIVNTLAYAAMLFVLLGLVSWMRHHLRRRAGRCTTCNYNLRGADHQVCPECGTATGAVV